LSLKPSGSKLNIIMFGFNDWETWRSGGFCTRCAKFAKLLSERPEIGKIVVVSTPKSIFTKFWRALGRRSGYSGTYIARGLWFSLRQVGKNVYALDHFRLLPREEASNLFLKINSFIHNRFLRTQILSVAKRLEIEDFILWLANPLMATHIGRLGERVSVFDAIDDWRLHPQKRRIRKTLVDAYERVVKKADIITTVSEQLKHQLSAGRTNVHWVPNGIDVAFFSSPRPAPPELAYLTHPIFEYVGRLQERVDVDLIEGIALAIPEASIALVGPVLAPSHFGKLKKQSNVHFLGPKNHADIPAFMQHADVCIMPHVVDDFTKSMNPLKLYEYIAAGSPVVATKIAGLESFKRLAYLAPDSKAFVAKLKALAGAELRLDMEKQRADFLHSCDWQKRLDSLLEIIEAHHRKSIADNPAAAGAVPPKRATYAN